MFLRRDEVQQPIRRFTLHLASQSRTPREESLPGRRASSVLEHVHQFVRPRFAFGRILAEHLATPTMNVFAQVVEVQAQGIQLGKVQLHLLANPRRPVHQPHTFVGLLKPQPVRLTTQQPSGRDVIAVREGHMLTLRVLAVEESDLELLPG